MRVNMICRRCGAPLEWFWETKLWACAKCPPIVWTEEE